MQDGADRRVAASSRRPPAGHRRRDQWPEGRDPPRHRSGTEPDPAFRCKEVGIDPIWAGRVFGVGGEEHAEVTQVDEFRIGQAVWKNWRVRVAGEGRSDNIAVFLGDPFFEQVDVEFDLAHNAVRLYETKDCDG